MNIADMVSIHFPTNGSVLEKVSYLLTVCAIIFYACFLFQQPEISTGSDAKTPAVGVRLFKACLRGEEDVVRELLKTATAEEANWQDRVSFSYYVITAM